ncbi:F-box/RNI-like superfamily protein [Rhynchospora pubera]|uniref:F-box/RNI-like superfamily protein n=1 Tax=Rhynchospora pubera TaxID=906938 RepID=A0AAV8H199_9POAL|nr:F-box/RNI-like superfamily protein [Rhynchospora pubera]
MLPTSCQRRVGAPFVPQLQTDLISMLPDNILSTILLLLPIKEAIRTSVLSSRWHDIWKLNPLNIDDSTRKFDNQQNFHEIRLKTLQAINRIASVHPGSIHSFRISQLREPAFHCEVDNLMETLSSKGVRELSLSFGYQGKLRYGLPSSLLQCQTLCKVSLSDCFFPPSPVVNSSFPNLRELTLEYVFLWDHLLNCLLESCAQLEVLQLIDCSGLQYVRLNCAKLQKLTIHERSPSCGGSGSHVKEMIIESAPELQSLRLGERTVHHTRILVQHVPKLEVLGFFPINGSMQIGNTFSNSYNQHQMSVNGSIGLPTVKKVALLADSMLSALFSFGNGSTCSLLSAMLRCFPCLETLYIKGSIEPTPHIGFWEQQAPFDFFGHHLKSVTVFQFLGMDAEVEFVKFFVQHGQVLERISLICLFEPTDKLVRKLRREWCLENRASIHLEVEFLHMTGFDPDSCEWAPLFHRPLHEPISDLMSLLPTV